MHPIERLRYVARAGDVDPAYLAQEAADALGSLAWDPRALVPACRRLIEFHPTCAPLWWVCARLLGANDVVEAADSAVRLLAEDPTPDELAATFPAGAIVVTDGGATAAAALSVRPDLTIRLVARPSVLRYGMRRIDGDVTGYDSTEADEACSGGSIVLIEPLACGPDGVLVDEDGAQLAAAAHRSGVDIWVVAAEGHILPGKLFDALCRHIGVRQGDSESDVEFDAGDPLPGAHRRERRADATASVLPSWMLVAVVGPLGASHAPLALRRATCPAPTELLEPSRGM